MNLKINKHTIAYALLICTFFPPASYIIPTRFTNLPRYIACLVILIVFFSKNFNNRRLSKRIVLMLIYFAYMFFVASALNYKNVKFESTLRWFTACVSFILLAEMGLSARPKAYLEGLLLGAGLPCVINIYTMFRYASSHGMYYGSIQSAGGGISTQAWYYFTHANAAFFITFPILLVVYYYLLLYNEKKIYIANILSVVTFVAYLYANSTTAWIVLAVFCIYMLFFWNPNKKSFVRRKLSKVIGLITNKWFLVFLIAVAIVLIVFVQITDNFSDIIAALGKSTDLTNRFPIWSKTINNLVNNKSKLLFGFGWEKDTVTMSKIGYNHCHNILLELVYRGGILGLLLFVLFTMRYLHGLQNTKMGTLLGVGLLVCLLATIMDFYLYRYEIYLIYVMIAHSQQYKEN